MRRLRPLSEVECYTRCYGGWEPTVRIVARYEMAARRGFARVHSGEAVRRLFEARLDAREPGVEREAA